MEQTEVTVAAITFFVFDGNLQPGRHFDGSAAERNCRWAKKFLAMLVGLYQLTSVMMFYHLPLLLGERFGLELLEFVSMLVVEKQNRMNCGCACHCLEVFFNKLNLMRTKLRCMAIISFRIWEISIEFFEQFLQCAIEEYSLVMFCVKDQKLECKK